MRWMILGGGGCFGLHLAKHLLPQGQSVVSVGRSPKPSPPWLFGTDKAGLIWTYEQCHIVEDFDRLTKLFDSYKPDVVVNFAALAYSTSWKGSVYYYDTNTGCVAAMTEYLSGKPYLKKFVQIGSSEVYGSTRHPASEDAALRPSSPYAVSKLAADLHVLALPRLPGVVVRPCNCYGEGQLLYRIIPRATWCALTGNRFPLQGGGQARKTWMHAEDLSRAIVTVVDKGRTHEVYNAGQVSPYTNLELMEHIEQAVGIPWTQFVEMAPPRPNEDDCYRLSSSKLYALGWSPKISLTEGINRVAGWMTKNLSALGEPKEFVLRP